jgi:hypothetical protein
LFALGVGVDDRGAVELAVVEHVGRARSGSRV